MSDVQTWRYSLPNIQGEGWAIIFIDSIGCFTALSDWGDVGYRWPQQGWGPGDFRAFLLQCDDSYLMGKLGQNRKEYDPESTLANVKDTIIQYRRDGTFDKDTAREEWDRLDTYDMLDRDHDFSQWYGHTKIEEAGECHCMRYVREVTGFIEHVMPRLRALLTAELAAPAPVAPVGAFMLGQP